MSWIDDLMFTPAEDPTLGNRIKAADLEASGGPGAPETRAEILLKQQTARNIAAQYALGNTLRARSAGAASQTASTGAADANAQATEQGVALQRQGQLDAENRAAALHQYADALEQNRTNARNQMLGHILPGAQTLGLLGQGGGASGAPFGSEQAPAAGEATGSSSAALGSASGAAGDAAATDAGLGLGSLAGAGVDEEAAALVSDPRAKKNVRPGRGKVTAMIRALDPKTFDYKDPGSPGEAPGRRVGVMAPALASTALGARAVRQDRPDEPMRLDTGNAIGLALAALPTLEARIRALEGRAHGR
jgi:hypothetical protein